MLTPLERRLGVVILEGFAPKTRDERALSPREGEVDYGAALDTMVECGNARARLGTKAAIYVVTLAPLFLFMHARTMPALSPEQRAGVLDRLLASHFFVVRELALLLKLTASFALLARYSVVERSHYHRGRPARLGLAGWEAAVEERRESARPAPRKLTLLQEVP